MVTYVTDAFQHYFSNLIYQQFYHDATVQSSPPTWELDSRDVIDLKPYILSAQPTGICATCTV